jgi:Domain of unknown function (DUF4214)/Beta-propeller repeat
MRNVDGQGLSWISGAIAVAISGSASGSLTYSTPPQFHRSILVRALEAASASAEHIAFEQNIGQFDQTILFYAQSQSHSLWVVPDGIALQPRATDQSEPPIRLRFGDLTPFTSIKGVSEAQTRTQYLLKTGEGTSATIAAPNFKRIVAKGVMFGVDVHIYSNNGEFEYDLVSISGHMPRSVLIRVEGAVKIELNAEGDAIIYGSQGKFFHRAPRVFESDAAGRREVKAFYRLLGMDDIELVIEQQNHLAEITVDPVLAYSGYIGGSAQYEVVDVAADLAGNIFVAGNQTRLNTVNPTIAKINASGSLLFSIDIAANAATTVKKISTDKSGNLIAVGSTCATNFPTSNAVYPSALGGRNVFGNLTGCDGFVAKFNGQTGSPIFSTYLGSTDSGDIATGVAIDDQERVHVVGMTGSPNFPALSTNFPSASTPSVFYARFTSAGAIEAIGRPGIGSVDGFHPPRIALDGNGLAVIAGTLQASGSFPETNFDFVGPVSASGSNGFVAAINIASNSITYASRIGGSGGATYVADLTADDFGSVYLLGNTGAAQSFFQGLTKSSSGFSGSNNFLARVDSNRRLAISGGSPTSAPIATNASIGYSRFLPFSGVPYALASNRATRELSFSLGFALPKSALYQIGLNAVLPTPSSVPESFIVHAAPDGQILYATKLGGSGSSDYPVSLNIDSAGDFITGGYSDSSFTTAFPVVPAGIVGTKPVTSRSATLAKISAPLFKAQFDVRPGFERVSNAAFVTTSNGLVSLTVTPGGEFSVGCNGVFVSTPTTVASGASVCVRHTASQIYSAITTSVLNVNGVDEPFFTVSAGTDDQDNDGIPDAVEAAEGLDWKTKDNTIFSGGSAVSDRLFAMQQYRDFLGREAESAGLTYWTNLLASKTLTREQICRSFFESSEFQLGVPPIVRLYLGYFRRIPDHAGLWGWVDAFRAGTPLGIISTAFAGSAEFQLTYGTLNHTEFVTRLYQNILNRDPDTPGLLHWVNLLNSGATRGEIMLGFSESAEFQLQSANGVRVIMTYEGMLRRAAEPEGYAHWVRYLEAGNDSLALTKGFLFSQEYRNRFLK